MKIKLLSAWVGPKPSWYGKYHEIMAGYSCLEWACVPPENIPVGQQQDWMNQIASEKLGTHCRKSHGQGICDFRPAYTAIFPEWYADCDWWGWVDLDMLMGDLDEMLPPLLDGLHDVLTFKQPYLSGCFTLLRNTERLRELFRLGPWREILSDHRYHLWDESGYTYLPGENLHNLLLKESIPIRKEPTLMSYDAPRERHLIRRVGKKLFDAAGQEVLFHHFMSDIWPIDENGNPRR